jgi:hypothetical protein
MYSTVPVGECNVVNVSRVVSQSAYMYMYYKSANGIFLAMISWEDRVISKKTEILTWCTVCTFTVDYCT